MSGLVSKLHGHVTSEKERAARISSIFTLQLGSCGKKSKHCAFLCHSTIECRCVSVVSLRHISAIWSVLSFKWTILGCGWEPTGYGCRKKCVDVSFSMPTQRYGVFDRFTKAAEKSITGCDDRHDINDSEYFICKCNSLI